MPVDLGGLPADYIKLNKLLNKESNKSKFNPRTDKEFSRMMKKSKRKMIRFLDLIKNR
jgi:hypothetical protein